LSRIILKNDGKVAGEMIKRLIQGLLLGVCLAAIGITVGRCAGWFVIQVFTPFLKIMGNK